MLSALEMLECRRLLSVSLSSKGTLILTGTSRKDEASIGYKPSRIAVNDNGTVSSFSAKSVKRIYVDLAGGNDRFTSDNSVLEEMTLNGGKGDDTIRGGGAREVINGQSGNDTVNPGAGFFEMTGGPGTDTADFSDAAQAMTVNLDDNFNDGAIGAAMSNVHADFEIIYGSPFADELTASPNLTTMLGNSGDDKIQGRASADSLVGGPGNDTLNGGDSNDTVVGGKGNDEVAGASGSDMVSGGDGIDFVYAVTRLGGSDMLAGTHDTLYGGPGNDWLYGNGSGGDNDFFGEAGNDVMYGGSAGEVMHGGDGNDKLYGNFGRDTMFGDAGNDALDGDISDDELHGGTGNDTLIGGTGIDKLFGDSGDDFFVALDAEKDTLEGDTGDNWGNWGPDDVVSGVEFI